MTIIERDPLLPLQAAMYKRLSEDMAIMNESAKVFDRVDEEHYPRIIIGEDRSNPEDTDCYSATDIFSTVRIYTSTVGKVQAKRLLERVRFLLTKPNGFTIDGFDLVWGHCESAQILSHEDALVYQAVLEFSYRAIPNDA